MEIAPRNKVAAPRAVSDRRRDRRADIGGELLRWTPPGNLRISVGAILVLFSLYNLIRPNLASAARAGVIADGAVGVANGVIGGATGLAGIAAVIWCSLRGWPPAEQRAVFLPSGVAVFAITALWLGGMDDWCQYAGLVFHWPAGARSRNLGGAQIVRQAR